MNNSANEGAQLTTPRAQRVLAEQIKIIILQTPQAIAAPAALAAISGMVLWNEAAPIPMLATIFLIYATLFWWLTFYWRYKRENPPATDAMQWADGATLRTATLGCCWGAYSLVIFVPDSLAYQGFVVAFMYGLAAGAAVADGPHYRTFVAFAVPTLLPVCLRCFFEVTPASMGVGMAGIVGLLYNLYAGLNYYRITATSIQTRFDNIELVQELEQQKTLAEYARTEADIANLSKSRFLAAASHDLRQPVHALGLFASVAKRLTAEPERELVIDQIEASVGSLTALFNSLLDISRLDAGVLQPQIKTMLLAPMLQRLVSEYAAVADEKKIELRFRCSSLAIHTDPLLFEQITRNLMSNALRYTESGGVLITGRKRGGCARIEVWDTGIGIPREKQAQVFDEFYQIGNPERDRRHGVGLGLSIVKRITALLQHPMHLTSRVGRGSRFSIDVPLEANPIEEIPLSSREDYDNESVLFGVVIIVIDDEVDILVAISLLLKQWGCLVITADSSVQASLELQAEGVTPDIILSDYRLRDDETGITAIRTLQSTFGPNIPALLVTGDTSVNQLPDNATSGIEVLHKPLNAERLKQALIEKLTSN